MHVINYSKESEEYDEYLEKTLELAIKIYNVYLEEPDSISIATEAIFSTIVLSPPEWVKGHTESEASTFMQDISLLFEYRTKWLYDYAHAENQFYRQLDKMLNFYMEDENIIKEIKKRNLWSDNLDFLFGVGDLFRECNNVIIRTLSSSDSDYGLIGFIRYSLCNGWNYMRHYLYKILSKIDIEYLNQEGAKDLTAEHTMVLKYAYSLVRDKMFADVYNYQKLLDKANLEKIKKLYFDLLGVYLNLNMAKNRLRKRDV